MSGDSLRVVTLNFWGTSKPLETRLALAIKQLKALEPDVVCLQEVRPLNGMVGRTTADVLADALGMKAHYEVATAWDEGQEGLAILARDITETKVLCLPEARPMEGRLLLSARVATAGGRIWVHTTHLHYRLDDGLAREAQVLAVDDAIRACGRGNGDPPQILRGLTTLGGRRTHWQDAWLRLHREPGPGDGPDAGITWSSENAHTRPLRSLDLDRRIDYVMVTTRKKDGRGTVHDCRVVMTDRDEHGDCASDHYGVLADVQVVARDTPAG